MGNQGEESVTITHRSPAVGFGEEGRVERSLRFQAKGEVL
jgi:hypothetical protein